MGKKRNQKASRSEKRMQKLYNEAIREVKERNLNLDVLPVTDSEDLAHENSEEGKYVSQKTRKKPKEVLEESIKKQEDLRKPRIPLCVPVSRLIPFKLDHERGLEFPRDFCRDPTSFSWIPRSESSLVYEVYRARMSPSSDFSALERKRSLSCGELFGGRNSSVGDVLKIFPLRAGRVDEGNLPESHNRSQQLPPIYRQDIWRETMRRASEPSRSIPAKHDSWNMGAMSLMVGRPELYTREKCKSSVSLAERRFRLRAATITL